MKRLICVLVVALHLAGCTTITTVPAFEKDAIREGDQPPVVEAVTREEISVLKTAAAVAGVVLLVMALSVRHPKKTSTSNQCFLFCN